MDRQRNDNDRLGRQRFEHRRQILRRCTESDTDANTFSDANCNSYTDGNSNTHGNRNGNNNTNSYSNSDSDGNRNANGQACADLQAAPDARTASVVRRSIKTVMKDPVLTHVVPVKVAWFRRQEIVKKP